jgi:hypothetical protein
MEKGNTYGIKNGRLSTSSLKYSSNLIAVPIGSTSLTNPENIYVIATIKRAICVRSFKRLKI